MSSGIGKSAAWQVLREIYAEFGIGTRLVAAVTGSYLSFTAKGETRRLENGWTYETPSFYEKNQAAQALAKAQGAKVRRASPGAALKGLTFTRTASGASLRP
jgi:hypothetical protein